MAVKRQLLLSAISEGHSVDRACELACISRSTFHSWRKDDDAFSQSYDDAHEAGTDKLEDLLLDDARKPGQWIAKLAVLKARRPNKWRENVKIDATVTTKPADTDKLAAWLADMGRKRDEAHRIAVEQAAEMKRLAPPIDPLALDAEIVR